MSLRRAVSLSLRRLHAALLKKFLTAWRSEAMPLSTRSTLIIAPHQDDETFGCGGLIALKRRANTPVEIVFVTDGLQSHGEAQPADLGERRRAEALAAARVLGVQEGNVHFMNLPDAGLSTLTAARRQQGVETLLAHINRCAAEEVFVCHRRDRHPDHEATFALLSDALKQATGPVQVWQYIIWMPWLAVLGVQIGLSDLRGARRLNVQAVLETKRQAVEVYRSQHALLPPGFVKSLLCSDELFFPA